MKWWRIPFRAVDGEPCSNTYRLANNFVEAGFNVGRFIGLRSVKGAGLQPGDFVIGVDDHYSERLISDFAAEYEVSLKQLKSFYPESIATLRSPLIGIYSGEGAGLSYVHDLVEALEGMGFRRISLLTGPLTPGDLSGLDVLIFGGGDSFRILSSMRLDEARLIRQFIESGGIYIGICAGAMLPIKPVNILSAAYGGLEAWEELQIVECEILSDSIPEPQWPVFSSKRLGEILRTYPIKGLVKSKVIKRGLLTLGYAGEITMLHTGPLVRAIDLKKVFGRIESVTENVEYGIPCEEAVRRAQGASSIILAEHGSGKIVLFTSHVENSKTPVTQGLLGNALFLKTYGSDESGHVQHVGELKPEGFAESSESCRVLRLIRDTLSKLGDQIENVIPWLYASQLIQEAAQLTMLKQVVKKIMTKESVVLESIEESMRINVMIQEIKRRRFSNPQVEALYNSFAEWGYVVSKARKALPPILEKIIESQELMADLSTTIISSDKSDVERRFAFLWNILAGGKAHPEKGISASPGVLPPLISLLLNFSDSLEKMRFLRKVLTYLKY
ncbi:MAG: BPL-N domain-containing protein [Thermoproteota archaeon]